MNNKKALINESIKINSTIIIPEIIQNLKCFIGYDKNKVPRNPETGRKTIAIIQNRWGYQTALQGVEKHLNIKGIGVILGITSIGNLCGVDIDNCINEKGEIAPEAMEIINQLDTYAELSPSSKGIHCLFFAKKSGSRCKNSNLKWCKSLELYDQNRYFTLTGDGINNKQIEHRQKECDLIYKNLFEIKENQDFKTVSMPVTSSVQNTDAEKLRMGLKYNKKLRDYWNGERPTADESANDLGFMNCLMFWTNDNVNLSIETFKNSYYAQMKDTEHRKKLGRKDYLLRTAERAKGGKNGQL